MKRLYNINNDFSECQYQSDVKRLHGVAIAEGFYDFTIKEIQQIWEDYSETYCAGWLIMDGYTDDELVYILEDYCEAV